jgi:hypothetical protein
MLHPGLGDDAAKYESELTPYGMKLKQKPDGAASGQTRPPCAALY